MTGDKKVSYIKKIREESEIKVQGVGGGGGGVFTLKYYFPAYRLNNNNLGSGKLAAGVPEYSLGRTNHF